MFQYKRDARPSHYDTLNALAKSFPDRLSPSLRHVFEAASECSASGWLTTHPIADHRFAMPKGEFRDARSSSTFWLAGSQRASDLCVWQIFYCTMCIQLLL